jgi:hypothetical protein
LYSRERLSCTTTHYFQGLIYRYKRTDYQFCRNRAGCIWKAAPGGINCRWKVTIDWRNHINGFDMFAVPARKGKLEKIFKNLRIPPAHPPILRQTRKWSDDHFLVFLCHISEISCRIFPASLPSPLDTTDTTKMRYLWKKVREWMNEIRVF